jgi:Ca2+-binding EF-hand superfamily protein
MMMRRRSQSTRILPGTDQPTLDENGDFSAAAMKDIANAFMVFDINKKKCLEIDDISKILDSHNLGLPAGTVEDLFKAIDTDGNGKIE